MIREFLYSWLKPLSLNSSSLVVVWGAKISSLMVAAIGFHHLIVSAFYYWNIEWVYVGNIPPLFLTIDYPSTGIFSGIALLILTKGLMRRKSAAWYLGLVLFLYLAFSRLVYQNAYAQAGFTVILTFWLFFSRPYYIVRSGWPNSKQGLRVLIVALLIAFILSGIGFGFSDGDRLEDGNFLNSKSTRMIAANQELENNSLFINRVIYAFYLFSAMIGGYLLITMVKPVKSVEKRDESEYRRARSIVEKFGKSSYAFLTLLDDKIYFFSPGGSLVAYTVIGRVALTLGDPVGPPDDIPKAINEFYNFCSLNDWIPAFCLTLPDYLEQYRLAGFGSICMGQEGIINLHEFGLSGRARSNFRKRFNRMKNQGFRMVIYKPPVPQNIVAILDEISKEWLTIKNCKEKRFFLGRFDAEYIRNGLVATVCTPDDKISAFVNLVPEYQRNEISIDLMRRRDDALSGTMDFLFVSLFLWARNQGYDSFNMGLCALSGVGEQLSDSLLERFLHLIYKYGGWIYDFKGLFYFKEKFQPDWTPQYLVYPTLFSLPSIWIAMAWVNSAGIEIPKVFSASYQRLAGKFKIN